GIGPFHSTGISRHASASFFPAYGPDAKTQSLPVSHASPSGSVRFDFSGKNGAREREPQGRGLKIGSKRAGQRFTPHGRRSAAFSAGLPGFAPSTSRKKCG